MIGILGQANGSGGVGVEGQGGANVWTSWKHCWRSSGQEVPVTSGWSRPLDLFSREKMETADHTRPSSAPPRNHLTVVGYDTQ